VGREEPRRDGQNCKADRGRKKGRRGELQFSPLRVKSDKKGSLTKRDRWILQNKERTVRGGGGDEK